jgi:osmotically-inducible protein OsmY
MDVFSDSKIAQQLELSLRQAGFVGGSEITVTVQDGIVSLAGTVGSYFDSVYAQDVAAQTLGVRNVRSTLGVRSAAGRKTDGEISEAIQRNFWRTPVVYVRSPSVSVQDGVATLKGVVETFHELEWAREKAYDAGAKGVKNYLEVRNGRAPSAHAQGENRRKGYERGTRSI